MNAFTIGIFYYSLCNLKPRNRFNIHQIQLLILLKQKLIKKYSMNTILAPVVKDLLALVHLHVLTFISFWYLFIGRRC